MYNTDASDAHLPLLRQPQPPQPRQRAQPLDAAPRHAAAVGDGQRAQRGGVGGEGGGQQRVAEGGREGLQAALVMIGWRFDAGLGPMGWF